MPSFKNFSFFKKSTGQEASAAGGSVHPADELEVAPGPPEAPAADGPMEGGPLASAGQWINEAPDDAAPDGLSAADPDDDAAVKEMDKSSPLIANALAGGDQPPPDNGLNFTPTQGPESSGEQEGIILQNQGEVGNMEIQSPGGSLGIQDLMNQNEQAPGDGSVMPGDLESAESATTPLSAGDLADWQANYGQSAATNPGTPGEEEGIIIINNQPQGLNFTPVPEGAGEPPSDSGPDVNDPTAYLKFNPQPEPPGRPEAFEAANTLEGQDEASTLASLGPSQGEMTNLAAGPIIGSVLTEMEDDLEAPEL